LARFIRTQNDFYTGAVLHAHCFCFPLVFREFAETLEPFDTFASSYWMTTSVPAGNS